MSSLLYVLIMYCSGTCPEYLPPPNGVLLYTNLSECQEAAKTLGEFSTPSKKTRYKSTCATMYADPKQLDRILIPEQLEKLLKQHDESIAAQKNSVDCVDINGHVIVDKGRPCK